MMFYMISGGSGSGKSEYAEKIALYMKEADGTKNLIYIATMMPFDKEAEKKISRHRIMRKDKGFLTKECFTHLKGLAVPKDSTILLDCMSNLTANEMFQENGAKEHTVIEIIEGIKHLLSWCRNLVVVTNEIFSDGCQYDKETRQYIRNLGIINQKMAQRAEQVVEVVCGIPIYHKGNRSIENEVKRC